MITKELPISDLQIFNNKYYIKLNTIKTTYPNLVFFHDVPLVENKIYKLYFRKQDIEYLLKLYNAMYVPFVCFKTNKLWPRITYIRLT